MFATTDTSNKPTQTANNNIIITSKSVERQHASLSSARKRERWKKKEKTTGKRSGAITGVREKREQKQKEGAKQREKRGERGKEGRTATNNITTTQHVDKYRKKKAKGPPRSDGERDYEAPGCTRSRNNDQPPSARDGAREN